MARGIHHFESPLIATGPGGAWKRVQVPLDAEALFGTRGRTSVQVRFGRKTFATSIFPDGDGGHYLMVNKAMCAAAAVDPGDKVRIAIWRDHEPAEERVSKDFSSALKENSRAYATFTDITPAARREYVAWIESAKRLQTRARRIDQAIALLAKGQRRPKL